jgi:hypothetical protein
MKTFKVIFCEQHGYAPEDFRRKLFWKTVPWQARPLVALMGGFHAYSFEAEQLLMSNVGDAVDMNDVRTAINDYLGDSADRSWLREFIGIGISTRQLRTLARCYLPPMGTQASNPFGAFQKIAS